MIAQRTDVYYNQRRRCDNCTQTCTYHDGNCIGQEYTNTIISYEPYPADEENVDPPKWEEFIKKDARAAMMAIHGREVTLRISEMRRFKKLQKKVFKKRRRARRCS